MLMGLWHYLRHGFRMTKGQPINTVTTAIRLDQINYKKAKGKVFVKLPTHLLRGFLELGAQMQLGRGNPFVETAKVLIDKPDTPAESTPLAEFYQKFQPRSAAEFLGLTTDARLQQLSPWEAQLPWDAVPGAYVRQFRENAMLEQATQYKTTVTAADGYTAFGPVSNAKLNLEIRRLEAIIESVQQKGYQPTLSNNHVTGRLLTDGHETVCVLREGNHRASVLAALGISEVIVLVELPVVNKLYADKGWPGIKYGFFEQIDALEVFNRILKGKLPSGEINHK